MKELPDHVNQCCSNGGEVVEQPSLQYLIPYQTLFFSIDLAQYSSSALSREFQELVCGVMEVVGKPNIADYFPVLCLVDTKCARRRATIYYEKLMGIFDGIIKE